MKYKFEDWEKGIVTLRGTYYSIPNGKEPPLLINWDEIDSLEQQRIRDSQQEIFTNLVNNEYDLIVNEFDKRYDNSDFKDLLVQRELNKLHEVLFENHSANPTNSQYSWGNIHPFNAGEEFFVKAIRRFFHYRYIDGFTVNFDFVNSPKSPYCLQSDGYDLLPEIQAEVLYRYLLYLGKLSSEKVLHYDKKYWSVRTFDLFKFLNSEYHNSNTISKFNLIFHFLKHISKTEFENYQFSMKKDEYIEFVQKRIDSNFISKQGGKPTMNPPETDEKGYAFNTLIGIKKRFESME